MKTLIIIDDDARLSAVLTRRFESEGTFDVRQFTSAKAALGCHSLPVFGIFLDMMLGDNEVGLDFIAELKKHYSPAHLIVMTGYASIPTTVTAMKQGATDYVTKPVSFATLLNKLSDEGQSKNTEEFKPMTPAQAEWEHIQRALYENNGNISATAKTLGLHRRTLQRKLQKLSPTRSYL